MTSAKPVVSAIVAIGKDGAIGKGNDMLWHLPDDFRHFKQVTMGHPVIMGRNTFESLGRLLPGRLNIIITRQANYQVEGGVVVDTIARAIEQAAAADQQEVFIIGGGQIYEQSFDLLDKLYLTVVDATFPEAEVFFPHIDWSEWQIEKQEHHDADERHAYAFTFYWMSRKR